MRIWAYVPVFCLKNYYLPNDSPDTFPGKINPFERLSSTFLYMPLAMLRAFSLAFSAMSPSNSSSMVSVHILSYNFV